MQLGDLDISVRREGKRLLFHVQARPYGHETTTTPEEVGSLGRFLVAQAKKFSNEEEK